MLSVSLGSVGLAHLTQQTCIYMLLRANSLQPVPHARPPTHPPPTYTHTPYLSLSLSPTLTLSLHRVTPQLDLVLLSQPDLQHLGALPYLVGKGGLTAPVYAAAPIAKLGCIFYHDCYTSKHVRACGEGAGRVLAGCLGVWTRV